MILNRNEQGNPWRPKFISQPQANELGQPRSHLVKVNKFKGIRYEIAPKLGDRDLMNKDRWRVISGLRRCVNEICALLGFYAARIGILLPKFRDCPTGLTFKGQATQVTLLGLPDPRTWDR